MWNPKRILLLLAGFALFLAVYLVYARFLGGIDGLPPLPQAYWAGPTQEFQALPVRQNNADKRLRDAFGQDCPEAKWSIRLEVAAHNLVLAAQDFTLENGRVKLWPFSVAIFSKEKDPATWPEINTVRADVAYLSFDRPVNNVMEIGSRRIVGGELSHDPKRGAGSPGAGGGGGVTIVSNRGTAQRDDDVSVFTPGPIHYDEKLNRSWTDNVVLLTDHQTKPKPTTINAVGMVVFLRPAGQAAPGTPKPGKGRAGGFSGADKIVLKADVNMHLWIDSQSGFLGGRGPAGQPLQDKSPAPKVPPQRVQLVVTCPGPFTYDLGTYLALFEAASPQGSTGGQVVVNRINEAEGKNEQLTCERLELQFQRKQVKPTSAVAVGAKPREQQENMDIRSARATMTAAGRHVTITSETENMHASGSELVYDAAAQLTTLKGPNMVAIKDGNEIHARELRLKMDERAVREVVAPGPGRIALLDREKGQRHQHALWQDELIATREGDVDVLLLTGRATFEDQQQGQRIRADRLRVWLEPEPAAAAKTPDKPSAEGSTRAAGNRRPRRMEARGNVAVVSPEMNVRQSELLVIRFTDAPVSQGPPVPAVAGSTGSNAPAPPPAVANAPSVNPPGSAPAPSPQPPPGGVLAAQPAKPKKPMDVTAQSIEARVLRNAAKNELDKLICRGGVRVKQDPATADDKEVDIRGDSLELTRHAEGNVLVVIGKSALVKFDKLTILGPIVTIDQKSNRATVEGTGAMTMPSNTSFDGGKLEKTTMLVVHWNKSMFFDGKFAEFAGNVQAEQDGARLACQTMQVDLDREVSFREGGRKGETPKVHQLVCDANVRIEDQTIENGRIVAQKKLSAGELSVDNLDGRVRASGPGVVRLLQMGTKGTVMPGLPSGRPQPAGRVPPPVAPNEQEMKLTRVQYSGAMVADNNTKTVMFFKDDRGNGVQVVHLPATDIDTAVDADNLPAGGVYLHCQLLKVLTTRAADGKTLQVMEAYDKVIVRAQDFWGRADVVKYNEEHDVLIFEAKEGNIASLYRTRNRGGDYEEIKGKKILYWRQKNEHRVEGAVGIRAGN